MTGLSDDPRSVGQILREERQRKSLSALAVAEHLRIRPRHLEALEEDRYSELPGQVYIIGYIRALADHMHLDGEALVEKFRTAFGAANVSQTLSFPTLEDERRAPGRFLAAAAVILGAIVYVGWYKAGDTNRPASSIAEVPAQLRTESVEAAPPVPAPTPSYGQIAQEPSDSYLPAGGSAGSVGEADDVDAPAADTTAAGTPPADAPPADAPAAEVAPADVAPAPVPAGTVDPAQATVNAPGTLPTDGTAAAPATDLAAVDPVISNQEWPVALDAPTVVMSQPKAETTVTPPSAEALAASAAALTSANPADGAAISAETAAVAPPTAPAAPTSTSIATPLDSDGTTPAANATDAVNTSAADGSAPVTTNVPVPAELPKRAGIPDSRIKLRARLDSFVSIRDPNGAVLLQRVLRVGDEVQIPNTNGLEMTVGNAGGLEIHVDGKPAPALGSEGQIRRAVLLNPEKLAAGQS